MKRYYLTIKEWFENGSFNPDEGQDSINDLFGFTGEDDFCILRTE